MKLSVIILVAAILATILLPLLGSARSIPATSSKTVQTPVRREANPADRSLSGAQNGPEALEDITDELALANLSIPSYLKDLYVNFTIPDGLENNDKMAVNTIRSYENRASSVTSGCGFYKFDVEKQEIEGEEIIQAELRLLQKATLQTDHYDVNIYYILREKDLESPLKLTFKHIDATPGWKTFDITPIAQGWKQGWVNHGIQIKLTAGHYHHLSCDGVFYKGEEDEKDTEPLLVVFTHDYDSKFLGEVLKENKHSTTHIPTQPQRRRREVVTIHKSCDLETFMVDHEALSNGDLKLFYPDKPFNIGMCGGHCARLQTKPATDHAMITSLQYFHSNQEAVKRCCVPIEYEPINMIYYNSKNKEYTVTKYSTAKATKCGCL